MAKKLKSKKKSPKVKSASSFPKTNSFLNFIHTHPNFLPLFILFVLLLIFFNDVMFEGKTFLAADTIASQSVLPYINDARAKNIYPLWNPYIFGGMPSFGSLQYTLHVNGLVGYVNFGVYKLLKFILPIPEFTRILLNYLIFGLFIYLLMIKKTGTRLVGLFACLAFIFQPQVISFAAFGHSTKLLTALYIPIIFLLLDELLNKRQLHYFALLALAIGSQLLSKHTQIAYYTFMMIGMYLIYWVVDSKIHNTSYGQILKSISMVLLALVIGIAMSSWLYLSVLEYAEYSIRGGGIGLDYSYATNWSFSPKEIITFFIPSFMGFGGETYWGPMPFTDYPLYMGIIPLLLAGMALILKRDRYVMFFTILAVIALIISFGKHLPILYGPLFKFLPFFNKFRVPTMIHVLLGFSVVVLAGIGLNSLLNLTDKDLHRKVRNYIYVFGGLSGLIVLFLIFGKSVYLNWIASSGKRLATAAQEVAYNTAATDGLKLVVLLAVAGFIIIYYLLGKINKIMFGVTIIVLMVIDLWLVDFKMIHPKPKADKDNYFAATEAVKFLKSQTDVEPFRIYPVYEPDKPDNWYMYHKIQNIRGYSAAKLKIYQTFLEKTTLDARNRYGVPAFLAKYLDVVHEEGQPSLQAVPFDQISTARLQADNAIMDMLNVKYLISYYPIPDPRYEPVVNNRPFVFENTGVLPRAFFVDEIKVIKETDTFFNYLNSGQFNPAKEAVLAEEPTFDIVSSADNRVQVTSYDIHHINLEAEVVQPALLVLSEIYYPAGWKAFVDGKETKIYRTNYILRSILLEPGSHEVKFVFQPKTFKLGIWITFSILFVLLALLVYAWRIRGKQKNLV